MKEKLVKSFKKLQSKSIETSVILMMLIFSLFIYLSLKNDGLFVKEILICGFISLLVLFISNIGKQ